MMMTDAHANDIVDGVLNDHVHATLLTVSLNADAATADSATRSARARREHLVAVVAAAYHSHGAQYHDALCGSVLSDDETACDCGTTALRDALAALGMPPP